MVARVAVPVGDEDFERPEGEKAVDVDAVRQRLPAGGGVVRNRGGDGVYVRPVVGGAVRLLLESPAMGRDEVAHRPLVQVAVRVGEFAREHRGLDVFHVDVQAEIFAIDRYGGEVAARRGMPGGGERGV